MRHCHVITFFSLLIYHIILLITLSFNLFEKRACRDPQAVIKEGLYDISISSSQAAFGEQIWGNFSGSVDDFVAAGPVNVNAQGSQKGAAPH